MAKIIVRQITPFSSNLNISPIFLLIWAIFKVMDASSIILQVLFEPQLQPKNAQGSTTNSH